MRTRPPSLSRCRRELLDDEVTAAIRNMNPKTRNAPKGK